MKSATSRSRSWNRSWQDLLAIGFVLLFLLVEGGVLAQEAPAPADAAEAAQVPPEQLESLVAPIALYPDVSWRRRSSRPPTRSRSSSSSNGWRRTRT